MAVLSIPEILLPKKRANPKGSSQTNTYTGQANSVLSSQDYRAHLKDIFTDRVSNDSRALLASLFKYDSDISAAVHAYMTVANTTPRFLVYTQEGVLDREGQKQFQNLIRNLIQKNDYSQGFAFSKSLREIAEDLRYMILLRGGAAVELVFNKLLLPVEVRQVDLATIEWQEPSPAVYKPEQTSSASNVTVSLDIPNLFVKYYRQNPTEIYTESQFVSSINTIAARQQVINDLYRIMQKTGYPRIEATVVEEVLRKNAPASVQANEIQMAQWIQSKMAEIGATLSDLRPDTVWVHTDSVTSKVFNEKGPGSALDVTSIIDVLNAQNQAALKTVATVIGRGESGVNTASVEARIFSLSAESLNGPVADLFSDAFTLALRLTGYQGYVECRFDPVELRPDTELEPQRVMKQSRLKQDLSDGLITDDEYHLMMYNRPRPDTSPEVSGTKFLNSSGVDVGTADKVSPNSDPLGRSITPSGSKSAKSNSTKIQK